MYKSRLQLPSLLWIVTPPAKPLSSLPIPCSFCQALVHSAQVLVHLAKPLLLMPSPQGSYPTSTACAGPGRRVGLLGPCLLSWIEPPRSLSFGSGPSSVLLLQSQEVSSTRCRLMARPQGRCVFRRPVRCPLATRPTPASRTMPEKDAEDQQEGAGGVVDVPRHVHLGAACKQHAQACQICLLSGPDCTCSIRGPPAHRSLDNGYSSSTNGLGGCWLGGSSTELDRRRSQ